MKMDHRIVGVVVVIANNCLGALLDIVCRTWCNAIVTYKVGRPQIRINLLLERLDCDLVKVYLLSIDIGGAVGSQLVF
jgi:hypothetical protein